MIEEYAADPLDIGTTPEEARMLIEHESQNFNLEMFRKTLRARVKQLKIERPLIAKELEEHFFNEELEMKKQIEFSKTIDWKKHTKYYPGSKKGPDPEDDPDHYLEWFINNYPKDVLHPDGSEPDWRAMGIKIRSTWQRQAEEKAEMRVEEQNSAKRYAEDDEAFPMANYKGIPEFDIADIDQYEEPVDGKYPHMRFYSNKPDDEPLPLPPEHTLRYHDFMYELERWDVFNALPKMISYDKNLLETYNQIQSGLVKVPSLENHVVPSLFAYYETLPSWVRNDPYIRNVVMAFEHHKPNVPIEQKELALNFACSLIRPIEGTFREVVVDLINSNPVQVDIKTGLQAMNDLPFWVPDHEKYGADDEHEEDDNRDDQQREEQLDAMNRSLNVMDESSRKDDMRRAAEQDMSIENYQVQPATLQCMTDYQTFDYIGPDDIEAYTVGDRVHGLPPEELPLNYYDNEDGFWDDYIEMKKQRYAGQHMITRRPFFKH